MVIIGFTYLHHPEQPLAHSSVSSYQRLYSPASNKVHTRTSSLSATIAAAGTGWDRGARQLGQTTGIPAFQIQQQAAKAHKYMRSEIKSIQNLISIYTSDFNTPTYSFYITTNHEKMQSQRLLQQGINAQFPNSLLTLINIIKQIITIIKTVHLPYSE